MDYYSQRKLIYNARHKGHFFKLNKTKLILFNFTCAIIFRTKKQKGKNHAKNQQIPRHF